MMTPYCIAYISDRVIPDGEDPADQDFLDWQLDEILAVSRKNNSVAGVTGALLATESAFFQVLEGPHSKLRETFERIKADVRHSNIRVLVYRPLSHSLFGNWSMAKCDDVNPHLALTRAAAMAAPESEEIKALGEELLLVLKKSVTCD